MQKGNTRDRILEVALALFSVNGYEATSVSEIAAEVGIQKASLYSHFESKQEILECIIREIMRKYARQSIFSSVDWSKPDTVQVNAMHWNEETLKKQTMDQLHYILHTSELSMGRKMLVIEQFKNPELGKLLTKQNYDDVLSYYKGLFSFLIQKGVLKDDDPEMLAAEYCLPISVWLEICDRDPSREEEIMALIEKHIHRFFRVHHR